jgi:hypothetical protein
MYQKCLYGKFRSFLMSECGSAQPSLFSDLILISFGSPTHLLLLIRSLQCHPDPTFTLLYFYFVSIAASSFPQRACYICQQSSKHEEKPVVSYYSDNNMSLVRSHNTTWYGNTTPATGCRDNEKLGTVASWAVLRQSNGNRDWVINGNK